MSVWALVFFGICGIVGSGGGGHHLEWWDSTKEKRRDYRCPSILGPASERGKLG